jgi:hypothetical protein
MGADRNLSFPFSQVFRKTKLPSAKEDTFLKKRTHKWKDVQCY